MLEKIFYTYSKEVQHNLEEAGLVRCAICGLFLNQIHILHLRRTHNISLEEYQERFPKGLTHSEKWGIQRSLANMHPLDLTAGQLQERSERISKLWKESREMMLEGIRLVNATEENHINRVLGHRSNGEAVSENNRRRWADPEDRASWSKAIRDGMAGPLFRERRAEISRNNWKDPGYVRKTMEGRAEVTKQVQEPSMEQVLFHIWVNQICPDNNLKANKKPIPGARLIPDFIDEGDKKVIEYFGVHWHGPETNRPTEEEVIERYQKAGYQCLIIWSDEVGASDTEKKIKEFLNA